MIKFSCPHCNRVINVKEEMAGKKGKCTACKEPITVPSAPPKTKPVGRSGDDLEALAASLLAEPKPQEDQAPTTVEFTCPYCDAAVRVGADLAGKQTPCPECRRIVKVPHVEKTGPRDWKRPDEQKGPTGAKRDDAAPEGAWGTETSRANVSRAALVEAQVIKEVRAPLTVKQWIGYCVAVVTLLVFGGIGLSWFLGARKEKLEVDGVRPAEELLAKAAPPLASERRAALHALLGEYHHRAQTYDKARDRYVAPLHFREARKELALVEDPIEKQALARQLLVLANRCQLGEDEQGEILALLPAGGARDAGLRAVARLTLAGAAPEAVPQKMGALRQLVQRGLATTGGGADVANVLDGLGIVGQEAVRAGHADAARQLADAVRSTHKADQLYPVHFAALLAVLKKPDLEGTADRQLQDLAQVEALAQQALVAPAIELIGKQFTTPTLEHAEAELLLAEAMIAQGQQDQAAARLIQEVIPILERHPGGLPWQRQRFIELLVAAGKLAEAERLAPAVLEEVGGSALARGRLAILEAKLNQADGASSELAKTVPESTRHLAASAIARRQGREDPRAAMAWAQGLDDETTRAFGMLGATLGMQDGQGK